MLFLGGVIQRFHTLCEKRQAPHESLAVKAVLNFHFLLPVLSLLDCSVLLHKVYWAPLHYTSSFCLKKCSILLLLQGVEFTSSCKNQNYVQLPNTKNYFQIFFVGGKLLIFLSSAQLNLFFQNNFSSSIQCLKSLLTKII